MQDPVTYTLELTGIKPIDLAKQLELSRQYISRAQMGCHVNLNKRLVQWIRVGTSKEFEAPLSRVQIRIWYETFKMQRRQENFDRIKPEVISYRLAYIPLQSLGPEIEEEVSELLGVSSLAPVANLDCVDFRTKFIKWRQSYWPSTYRFATDMCLHPASIDNFEQGTVRGIPGDLKAVLDWMVSYSHDQ